MFVLATRISTIMMCSIMLVQSMCSIIVAQSMHSEHRGQRSGCRVGYPPAMGWETDMGGGCGSAGS